MPGAKWKNRRRLLTPAFHFQILNTFIEVFNKKSVDCARVLDKAVGQNDGNEIDVYPIITQCALEIICGNLSNIHNISYVTEFVKE